MISLILGFILQISVLTHLHADSEPFPMEYRSAMRDFLRQKMNHDIQTWPTIERTLSQEEFCQVARTDSPKCSEQAVYSDGKIFINPAASKRGGLDGVLLHELVHHVQAEIGTFAVDCIGIMKNEKEAYFLQSVWLRSRGDPRAQYLRTLSEEFDPKKCSEQS